MHLQKARNIYVATAISLFNLLVIFVAINLAVAGYELFTSTFLRTNPIAEKYRNAQLALVYPGKTQQQIDALLGETWSRSYVYEAFTQFSERPYRGQYVNVDAHGFRQSADQAPWPPDPSRFNVFVFGGSTTFGYGVADAETVPSRLQEEIRSRSGLPVAVYNFGRGFYYSTQERVLFEQLVSRGLRPQLAIFIDGLNEFYYRRDEPLFTSTLRDFLDTDRSTTFWSGAVKLPAVRVMSSAARSLRCRLRDCAGATQPGADDEAAAIAEILGHYRTNKRLIEATAAAFGIVPVFVWQPVPTFKYDLTNHVFAGSDFGPLALTGPGFGVFAAERRDSPPDDLIWCADIQDGRQEPLYVDQVHYTAAFAKTVAACIAAPLQERGLLVAR
jgi:hypothetical protein